MTTPASNCEFWAAILGAIVGGLIALGIQYLALRESRRQRAEDRRILQQALGTALIFKISRIYSNLRGLHAYLEECFERAEAVEPHREAWQVLLPLTTFRDRVLFTTDEMGMLLAMKNDDVFDSVCSMDDVHNDLWGAVKTLQEERTHLLEKLSADSFDGDVGKFEIDHATQLRLRPRMIKVNRIAEQLRANTKRALDESKEALPNVHKLLRDKLELSYQLEFIGSEST